MKQKKNTPPAMELAILQGAVDNANDAFITIDESSIVLFYNKVAQDLFGFAAEEVLGRDLAIILAPQCQVGHKAGVDRYLATRKGTLLGHAKEFIMARKDGSHFSGTISFSVVEIEGRLYFTGIVRDITEEKRMREELQLAERLMAMGRAVAEINHEIKNPLTLIGGFARQLARKSTDEGVREKVGVIVAEVERLEKLLAGMRDLYADRKLLVEDFCLRDLVGEVSSLIQLGMEEKDITLTMQSEGSDFTISGDKQKIRQVLLNVFKNAVEAMAGSGDIDVRLRQEGDKVALSVADAGTGISPEVQARIFDPFFTTKQQGTGLGLPISKRIVEDHCGGVFSIKSEEGKGTEVTIVLGRCGSAGGVSRSDS